MLKFLKSIALLLVGTVMGGALCAEVCAFASLAPTQQQPSMPCHHQKTPAKPECTHHDLVADRLVGAGIFHYLPPVTFLPVYLVDGLLVDGISTPLTSGPAHWPEPVPRLRPSVLRI